MEKLQIARKQIIISFHDLLKAKRLILLLGILLAFTSVHAQQTPQQPKPASSAPAANPYKDATISYKVIDAADSTYGYDVFADGKLMIHQTSIPAVPGNDGFKTKDDAEKVAKLVIEKIRKGEMPPMVTPDELKKLNVIK